MKNFDMPEKNGYTFYHVPSRGFPSITGKETQNLLMQWSLKGRLHCQCFSFDETFKQHDIEAFAKPIIGNRGRTARQLISVGEFTVKISSVPCTLTSMEIFDRCIGTVVHKTGRIKSCLEEYCGSLIISDCLTRMLCAQESEFYKLYCESERAEFLFRLFKHIVIGGELVQPSEDFNVYTNFVRTFYKDLISVQKLQETDDLVIISKVFEVRVLSNHKVVYPAAKEHINTFAYLIVNPIKRHVIALSHVYGIGQY
ncbi:hypothetical protein Aperf_G00000088973 [Anoplocephala perfoliata]